MFSHYNCIRRPVISLFVVCTVFMLFFVRPGFTMSSLPPVFTNIEVQEIAVPDQFNSARCYQITYFNKSDNGSIQVFPTLEEKQRDADLILASVVRQYLGDEYESQGKYMDEHLVESADLGKVIDLVAKEYVSKAWKDADVNFLRQYILKNQETMQLYTLHVYLEHFIEPGNYFSGLDINPILLHFNDGKRPDVATFITVNYSDK